MLGKLESRGERGAGRGVSDVFFSVTDGGEELGITRDKLGTSTAACGLAALSVLGSTAADVVARTGVADTNGSLRGAAGSISVLPEVRVAGKAERALFTGDSTAGWELGRV
jgi:hypothetical protein